MISQTTRKSILKRFIPLTVVWISTLILGCEGNKANPLPTGPGTQTFSSEHFVFYYTSADAHNINQIAAALEAQFQRILTTLQVSNMPGVNVHFYVNHQDLEDAVRPFAGNIGTSVIGLITGITEIHMMSPNLPQWGTFDQMITNLVHEFIHCVSMRVNSNIPNHPRWLWEAVALYLAGQLVNPHSLDYMVNHEPPTFEELNRMDSGRIYEVGYTISEFIVSEWEESGLRALITNNGNTQLTFGIAQPEFEENWFAFVRRQYGI